MSKKKFIIIIVLLISFSVLSLIGTTYALFTKTVKGEKNVKITSGNLNKEFYNENHNNFSSEILANDFALDFVSYLLQGLIEPDKLQYEIELIKERIEKNKTCITFDTIDNAYTNILNKNGKEKTLKYIRSAFEKEN